MRVKLIDYTQNAVNLLIFTKRTRLTMNPKGLSAVAVMEEKDKEEELKYMANTIPSSWEFVNYTFLIERVSRAFTHQFVRTRNASFAQQSMRVTTMDEYDFIMPDRFVHDDLNRSCVNRANSAIQDCYTQMLNNGAATEDARSILPTNIATNIVAQFNMRALVELCQKRLGGRTQKEYRDVLNAMVDRVLEVHPWMKHFFFANAGRDHFKEIEDFAEKKFGGDLQAKGELLKIVDAMRAEK